MFTNTFDVHYNTIFTEKFQTSFENDFQTKGRLFSRRSVLYSKGNRFGT